MLNGLDLFSGIGGLALALEPWSRPVAYCDNDRYAQAVILSRMARGELPQAPIWDDVRTLVGDLIPVPIDLIYGGFPCQDLSVAGLGKGLAGERSGLVFEVLRLVDELRPAFLFLENVPAIRTRGAEVVGKELARRGYDSRWTVVSAAEVGAPHLRKRWFLLAHRNGDGLQVLEKNSGTTLTDFVTLFPTPTASDYGTGANGVRKGKQKQILSLNTMARKNLWPTPCASEGEKGGPGRKFGDGSLTLSAMASSTVPGGGKLSPLWVEWLMAYPIGWTVLEDWVTQSYLFKRERRSKGSSGSRKERKK